jgi:hypothetical protein
MVIAYPQDEEIPTVDSQSHSIITVSFSKAICFCPRPPSEKKLFVKERETWGWESQEVLAVDLHGAEAYARLLRLADGDHQV